MAGCCCAEACTAAVLIGVLRLPCCPFDCAWRLVSEVCRLTVDCVDCKCFLSFVFLGGARRLELSPWNTRHSRRHSYPLGARATLARCGQVAVPQCMFGQFPPHVVAMSFLIVSLRSSKLMRDHLSDCGSQLLTGLTSRVTLSELLRVTAVDSERCFCRAQTSSPRVRILVPLPLDDKGAQIAPH